MIDQLPEHRTLPGDVRLRARRRLSQGMRPAVRNGRPALIAAGVSVLAAGAVFASQTLLGGSTEFAGPPMRHNGEFVGKDPAVVNHVERGKVAPDVLVRCAAAAKAHPPSTEWLPVATSHKAGTTLTAFRSVAGFIFCANTATTTTISVPIPATPDPRYPVEILFTSPTGAIGGIVSGVSTLHLSRIGDKGSNNTIPAIVDEVLLAPSGFTKAQNGTMALANGEEFAVRGVPQASGAVVDRPLPPADRATPEQQTFAKCLRDRPVPDAEQFAHGLTTKVSATDTMILGRFGDLLFHCRTATYNPSPGSVYDLDDLNQVRGQTIAGTTAFYDFQPWKRDDKGEYTGGGSTSSVLIGLILDPRAVSVTYTSPGASDVMATIENGTFLVKSVLPGSESGARVVVRDAAGTVLETITPQKPS